MQKVVLDKDFEWPDVRYHSTHAAGARLVKERSFEEAVYSRCYIKEVNSRSRRAHIHQAKSDVATRPDGRRDVIGHARKEYTPASGGLAILKGK